ncbi:MAG: SpoIIE family protein phosphatase [Helicobacteraceae bacterium]|nr:SpoIIE family protein phosphatase [Helicobacteraceae bacterium]
MINLESFFVTKEFISSNGTSIDSFENSVLEIEHIFMTHLNYKFIPDLITLVATYYSKSEVSLNLYATSQVISMIKTNIFNDKIAPDYSQIELSNSSNQTVVFHELEYECSVEVEDVEVMAVRNHLVKGGCEYELNSHGNKYDYNIAFFNGTKYVTIDNLEVTNKEVNSTPSISVEIQNTLLEVEIDNVNKLVKKQANHIERLSEIGIALSSERDLDKLLGRILEQAKIFTSSDAGTLYLMSEDKKTLQFKVVETDSLNIKMGGSNAEITWPPLQLYKEDGKPNREMVAALCAIDNVIINIADVYTESGFNFAGTKAFDESTGYRSMSMLVLPLKDNEGKVIGVCQLINKKDKDDETIHYEKQEETAIQPLASQASIAINNVKLVDSLEDLLASLEQKVVERTVDLQEANKEVAEAHEHIRDSIEYASLIQGALIPDHITFGNYFKDYFVFWHPKDTVGGDIYLFNELRHEDECLLFFIDCTGHGVPGAFVTMIVKAVEREIILKITDDPDMDVSPAWIMGYFNRTMKELLRQTSKESVSNAGWDGGIIYYNKKDQILKFAGAETPLFYMDLDGELKTVKGNRYSVGYKKCEMDYKYKETILEVKDGMKFYCTTDGYLDQNGGEKDFPFGKKRFTNIIKEYHKDAMADQQEVLLYKMAEYEEMIENNDRNDDMTVIGFEIGSPRNLI